MGRANHKKVQEYSDDLKKMIAQGLEKRKKATEVIASTRNEIKNARQLGIDTTKAENLLSAGEKILENAQEIKYYDEAIKNRKIHN